MTLEAKSADNLHLMETPVKHSYSCSVESQVKLTVNDSAVGITNMFFRMTDISGLLPFVTSGKAEESKQFLTVVMILRFIIKKVYK